MLIKFYSSEAEPTMVDKTSELTEVRSLEGECLRSNNDIVHPVVEINIAPAFVTEYNYAYIQTFKRYYFIDRIEWVGGNVCRLFMRCDVLMSFKTDIKALSAIVARQENDFNINIVDGQQTVTTLPEIAIMPNSAADVFNTASAINPLSARYTVVAAGHGGV